MQNSLNLLHKSTFKNPFDDINANTIDDTKVLSLWCDPFSIDMIKDMDEKTFATSKLPIVLQGSRGSGKTMILKYFSYPVLKERAKISENKSIIDEITQENSVGFYFRCDDSFINTFQSIFKSQSQDRWLTFFEHYLELQFCSHLLLVLDDIINELDAVKFEDLYFGLIRESSAICNMHEIRCVKSLRDFVSNQLFYIDKFKNDSIFSNTVFAPEHLLSLYSLSETMIQCLQKALPQLKNVEFLILVDEFENLTEEIQRFFNTKIKFSHSVISFRIGRRSEGVATTETINNTEYLREGHDYRLINISKSKGSSEYFSEIAAKRLIDASFECQDIIQLFGRSEDLDSECKNICKGKDLHIKSVLFELPVLKKDSTLCDKVLDIIRYPDNPIMEALNALWVIRRKKNPVEAAYIAKKAMLDFIDGVNNAESQKYKNDYSNKYRYTLTVLIASIYRKEKMYYSFNTIVHLSDGNSRTFINICRSIISDAIFYERDSLIKNKCISPSSQNRAIHEFSQSEFEAVCSIMDYGNSIRNLLLNIGNILMAYHKDKRARYPETTQFTFDEMALMPNDRKIIEVALGWAMIIKKDKKQRLSTSIKEKGDIYYINHAFSPMFNISHRIRGGYNVRFSANKMVEMIGTQTILGDAISIIDNDQKDDSDGTQLTFFDLGDFE